MTDLDRKVVLEVDLDTGPAVAGAEQFVDAAGRMAASGKKVADGFATVNPGIQKVMGNLLQMGVRFQETGQVSQRSLAAVGTQLNELGREFGKTTSAADKLSAAERQAFTAAQGAYKDAIVRLRDYNQAMQEVNRSTRDWTSLEGALTGLGGTIGKVTTAVVGVAAALKTGWEMGERFDKVLQKLPSYKKSWEDLADNVYDFDVALRTALGLMEKIDTKFAGSDKTLGAIRARQEAARKALEAGAPAEDVFGQQLMSAYYTESLRKQKEAEAASIRAREEYVKRMEALTKALTGGGGLANVFDMRTKQQFLPSLDLLKQVSEQEQRDHEANARFDAAAATKRAEEWKRVNDEIIKNWDAALDNFASNMADVFTAGVIGGAEGFASAASKLFVQGVNEGAKGIFKNLAKIAFGAAPSQGDFPDTEQGRADYQAALASSAEQNQKLMAAVSTAVGAIGQTLQAFKGAKQGQEVSVLGTTLAFAAAGAAIGNWVGAIVGAVAGLAVSLFANAAAKKQQPYASYGIKDGVPYVTAFEGKERQFENVTAAMYNDMISQMQKTMESTQNDYIKLLLKFPNAVKEHVTALNFAPVMAEYEKKTRGWLAFLIDPARVNLLLRWTGLGQPGNKQITEGQIGNPLYDKNAQKNFMQDFQNWVNNTLPKEIIATFEAPLMEGFATLGLTADKFHQIWDRLQAIDPKDAIKSLNELYDALTAFQTIQADRGKHIYGGAGFEFTGGWLDDAMAANAKSFADQLAQADAGLVDLGASIELLIGPEQITQAKAWGDALLQRQQALQQFFQQVAQAIDNVIRGYQSSIRDLTLQGMTKDGKPDVGAQVNYLKKYADQLYQQIQNAPTMEAATALSAELQRVILQIQQIGGSQGIEAAEAFRLWAIEQLKAAQDLVVKRLQDLAQAVADQNEAFLDAIQGFIDAFLGATDQINNTTTEEEPTTPTTPPTTQPPIDVEDPWDWNRRRNGGNVLAFPQSSANSGGAYLQEQRETNRRLARLEEVLGRDISVSGGLDVTINDQPASTVPLSGGFERRTLNGRYRAS